jgi:hypothetical protein
MESASGATVTAHEDSELGGPLQSDGKSLASHSVMVRYVGLTSDARATLAMGNSAGPEGRIAKFEHKIGQQTLETYFLKRC